MRRSIKNHGVYFAVRFIPFRGSGGATQAVTLADGLSRVKAVQVLSVRVRRAREAGCEIENMGAGRVDVIAPDYVSGVDVADGSLVLVRE